MNEHISSGFSESLVLKIFTETCEAVAKLHQADPPVIHRDLKVINYMYSQTSIIWKIVRIIESMNINETQIKLNNI